MRRKFDVIVAGGGHAAAEAAHASARLGADTLLLAMNMDHIGQMSCNPAIGGIAKGQLVREIDALGGIMGKVADASSIQFRMLNMTKGPAVWSPRAQCDKLCYQRALKFELEKTPNLSIQQGEAVSFLMESGKISGVRTAHGEEFGAVSIVLAPGTFMRGVLHYGLINFSGGRAGDPPSALLPEALSAQLGFRLGRLKTGTPPRILAKTIDFAGLSVQDSDQCDEGFSFFPDDLAYPRAIRKNMPCHITRTTKETAEIVRRNISRSPLYQGVISGVGTRYCPSFEDKVMRFPHHETHLIYLEPEGEFTEEYYLNGISTSLPTDTQIEMIRSVPGLHRAEISRFAYAIEYDFVFPDQLDRALSSKKFPNLFLAGQINGTSGYEEAAGQGLVAGLNAARHAASLQNYEFSRESSYIGVMIDDLASKDIIEPYRLFTSRAEHRLSIRQDNANLRLCPVAAKLGLLPHEKVKAFSDYLNRLEALRSKIDAKDPKFKNLKSAMVELRGILPDNLPFEEDELGLDLKSKQDRIMLAQILISIHYEAYIERDLKTIEKMKKLDEWTIPPDFDYSCIVGLKNEARSKLSKFSPKTLAQASRIDGVTPSEICLLQIHIRKRRLDPEAIDRQSQTLC